MPSTTPYKPGDIVLVPFPFTDLSGAKQRPAIVLFQIPTRGDLVVAAITSQIPAALDIDEFSIPSTDLRSCGLPQSSIIRVAKIVTMHEQLVRKRIGQIPPTTFQAVLSHLKALLG